MAFSLPDDIVVVTEAPTLDAADELFDDERELTVRFVDKRLREFATGRRCARRALARLGGEPVSIPIGEGRQPSFPPGFVGSITHTDGVCAAAMARSTTYRSVGIDIERARPLEPGIAERISSVEELNALPTPDRLKHAMVLFSAKEAFYKLQYPLTGQFLGFLDVGCRLDGEEFEIALLRDSGNLRKGQVFRGRWSMSQQYVETAMYLEGTHD